MSKILVTGGAGYIGSILVPLLLDCGHEVTVVDNFIYKQPSLAGSVRHPNFKLVFGDVRNYTLMEDLLAKSDIVIPLAAIVGAPACDRDPKSAKSVNRDSVIWLFRHIGTLQQIIMPTTNSAYGSGGIDNYCDESSPLNPISLYAKDKVEVEERLMGLSNATSFRLATVFGISPRMRLDLLVNNFAFRAITDGFLVIFEGHFKRNYVHLLDTVQAFKLAIDHPDAFIGEVFNVGLSSANISKLELCAEIKRIFPSFTYFEEPFGKDPDQRNYIVSNSKIESRGFKPTVSLQQGLTELLNNLKMFDLRPYSNI
jgi:nucleoside-diphosphate-sugar epimerase